MFLGLQLIRRELATDLTPPPLVPVPCWVLDFQRDMSWFFPVFNVEVRDVFFVLLLLVELLTIRV